MQSHKLSIYSNLREFLRHLPQASSGDVPNRI